MVTPAPAVAQIQPPRSRSARVPGEQAQAPTVGPGARETPYRAATGLVLWP